MRCINTLNITRQVFADKEDILMNFLRNYDKKSSFPKTFFIS